MVRPDDNGISLFVSWGLLETILSSLVAGGLAVAAWVWNLGGKVYRLHLMTKELDRELIAMKESNRRMHDLLHAKIDQETERLEERMDRVLDKMDEIKRELPSRAFIEGQLGALGGRLDRMMDSKLVSRP